MPPGFTFDEIGLVYSVMTQRQLVNPTFRKQSTKWKGTSLGGKLNKNMQIDCKACQKYVSPGKCRTKSEGRNEQIWCWGSCGGECPRPNGDISDSRTSTPLYLSTTFQDGWRHIQFLTLKPRQLGKSWCWSFYPDLRCHIRSSLIEDNTLPFSSSERCATC